MAFLSPVFYVAMSVAALAFYSVPTRLRTVYLLGLSYVFYLWCDPIYLILLIFSTTLSFFLGRRIAACTSEAVKRLLMFCGIGFLLIVLFGFKFSASRGILLPLGMSYYTFKLISYLVEVYWNEQSVESDPTVFYLYPAFFPQIVSGPIQRPDDFFTQMRGLVRRRADYRQIENGFALILGGLMLKQLVGDRLAAYNALVDGAPGLFKYDVVLVQVLSYTLQVFADFCGYTNIALGIGKIFGIDGPPNFDAPFSASSVPELWRRWHMSLTLWMTDYIFTPLRMSFRDWGPWGFILATFASMLALGLWHGLSFNFTLFYLIHALLIVLTVTTAKVRAKWFKKIGVSASIQTVSGAFLTFVLFALSMVIFHFQNLPIAFRVLRQVLLIDPSGILTRDNLQNDLVVHPVRLCLAISFYVGMGCPGVQWLRERWGKFVPSWLVYGLGMFFYASLFIASGSTFVYGQF